MDTLIHTQLDHIRSKDKALHNKAFFYGLNITESPVHWTYDVWDETLAGLTHNDNLVRAIAAIKGIIQYFELTNLHYKPTPSWEFYDAQRVTIHEMKSKVGPCLPPTNAAFSWFLLLSFQESGF